MSISQSSVHKEFQTFLHREILLAGYCPERFADFMESSCKTGLSLSSHSTASLNLLVQQFKLLEGPEKIKCKKASRGLLSTIDACVNVTVGDVKIVKAGIFSKSYAVYNLNTIVQSEGKESIKSIVHRRFSDFEWLSTMLSLEFPFEYIPPLPDKTKFACIDMQFLRGRRNILQEFLTRLTNSKLLLTSIYSSIFLTTDDDEFARIRDSLKKNSKKSSNRIFVCKL